MNKNFLIAISKYITWIAVNIFLVNAIALQLRVRFFLQDLDSAFLVQLIDNNRTNNDNLLDSPLLSSFGNLWRFLGQPSSYWCAGDYSEKFNGTVIESHPYLIAMPLNWFKELFAIDSLNFTSYFFAIVIVAYFNLVIIYTWKYLDNLIVRLIVLIAFFIYPPILTAIQGQLYFDKIIIFLGPIFIHYLYNIYTLGKSHYFILYPLAFTIMLVSERGTIFVAITSTIFALQTLSSKAHRFSIIGILKFGLIPLISVLYFLVWYYQIQKSFYYENNSYLTIESLNNRINSLSDVSLQKLIFPFLVFTLPFLILIFTMNVWLGTIGLLLTLPNLIIDIGGAELNGYATHYHSLYAGSIWFLLLLGLRDYKLKSRSLKRINISVILLTSFLFVMSLVWFQSPGAIYRNLESNFIPPSRSEINSEENQKIQKVVDSLAPNSSLSMSRNFMPYFAMAEQKKFGYFPVLLNEADYVIVLRDLESKLILDWWFIRDPENISVVQSCLENELLNYKNNVNIDLGGKIMSIYSDFGLDNLQK
jgi:hypothetical protein